MGGANNRSPISAHFCISAYFLTAETYKRMRLTTQVYGMSFNLKISTFGSMAAFDLNYLYSPDFEGIV